MTDPKINEELISILRDFGSDLERRYNESMTVGDAARFLKVHKNQVLRYTRVGLPHYRMGNKYCFLLKDLIEFRENFRSLKAEDVRFGRPRSNGIH